MIDPADFARVKEVFLSVRDLPAAEQGPAIDAALDDDALRAEVRGLLGYDDDEPFIRPADPDALDRAPPPPGVTPPSLVGEVLDGRFAIHEMVAEGGFGWVYRGHDATEDGPVAVKLFKPIDDPGARARVEAAFVREGEVLEALAPQSDQIVAYRAVGTWTDDEDVPRSYIVMEWLDGVTLAAHAELRFGTGPMALADAIDLLAPIADGLRIAHAHGVAHRDVKPDNIVCVTDDLGVTTLKLVDFGAAKRAADRARGFQSTGGQMGMVTLAYGAPEQVSKAYGSTGPWSDVFALALVMVELLAGRHPWAGLDLLSTMDRAADPETRPTPRALGLDVPDEVEAVFARALAVNPEARHRDAGHFWSALTAAAEGEAPSIYVEVPPERGVSIMFYLIGLALMAGAGLWWWLAG